MSCLPGLSQAGGGDNAVFSRERHSQRNTTESSRSCLPRLRGEPASESPKDNVTPVTAFMIPERTKQGVGFSWEDGRPAALVSLCPQQWPVFTPYKCIAQISSRGEKPPLY